MQGMYLGCIFYQQYQLIHVLKITKIMSPRPPTRSLIQAFEVDDLLAEESRKRKELPPPELTPQNKTPKLGDGGTGSDTEKEKKDEKQETHEVSRRN